MDGKESCSIFGYDKDADVYELICACPSRRRGNETAAVLARHMAAGSEIRHSGTGRPFDWLVTSMAGDPYCCGMAFTCGRPEGFPA